MAKYLIAFAIAFWATSATAAPSYRIVSEDASEAALAVSVRIDARLSEADLASLADTIRAAKPTFKAASRIQFYLPDMPLGDAPWADVAYAPNENVSIKGLRLDEEESFRAKSERDMRDIIGVWLTSPPAVPGKLTIWREADRKIYAEWHLRNGSKNVDELIETRSQRGRRYQIVGAEGGYYLALWNGTLELGDKDNVIAVAERLQFQKAKAAMPVAASSKSTPQTTLAPAVKADDVNSTTGSGALATAASALNVPPAVIPKPTRRKTKAVSSPKDDPAGRSVREMLEASLGK